jgi:hypothetical protein
MKKITALLFTTPALISAGDKACEWAYLDPPPVVSKKIRATFPADIALKCPGKHQVGVSFKLSNQFEVNGLNITAPTCKAVLPHVKKWVEAQPRAAYVDIAGGGGPYPFTLVMAFGPKKATS